ncbi:MAG: hypothetical protein ABEJ28_06240 [Salinigranum sp.]
MSRDPKPACARLLALAFALSLLVVPAAAASSPGTDAWSASRGGVAGTVSRDARVVGGPPVDVGGPPVDVGGPPVVVSDVSAGGSGGPGVPAGPAQQRATPVNGTADGNGTGAATHTPVRHENPASVDQSGDLAAVQAWLSGHMGQVLIDCTKQTQLGSSYVCSRLDSEYPKWAKQYVDVAQRTDSKSDDNASRVLDDTRHNQRQLADSVRSFRRTYREYQRARENGDTARARRLGRRVISQADRVDATGGRLSKDFAVWPPRTGRRCRIAASASAWATGPRSPGRTRPGSSPSATARRPNRWANRTSR